MCTLLQSMMLLDSRHEGYEFSSISADEIMRYAAHIKNNYSEKQKERLYDIIDYLEKVFPEKDKMLKKINIPIVMLTATTAMGSNYDSTKGIYRVGPMYFRQWFSYFFDECYEDYKQYCSSGSIKKEKTLKRIEVMENSLKKYFELEEATDSEQDEQTTPLSEESSPDSEALLDGSMPLTDTDETEKGSQTENTEKNPTLKEESDSAPTIEGISPNAVSDDSEHGTLQEEDKPPEEMNLGAE